MATPPYQFHMDARWAPLEKMEIGALMDGCQEQWFNQTLCGVNDSVVRIGIIEGDFHWHKHDDEDEFFYVVEGRLFIDVEERPSVELAPREGYLVPRGVVHRTRAPERTVILMVEGAGVLPAGDDYDGASASE